MIYRTIRMSNPSIHLSIHPYVNIHIVTVLLSLCFLYLLWTIPPACVLRMCMCVVVFQVLVLLVSAFVMEAHIVNS